MLHANKNFIKQHLYPEYCFLAYDALFCEDGGYHKVHIYIKSTTVYVPSLELGLSHPLFRQRVYCAPPPEPNGRGPAGEGLG